MTASAAATTSAPVRITMRRILASPFASRLVPGRGAVCASHPIPRPYLHWRRAQRAKGSGEPHPEAETLERLHVTLQRASETKNTIRYEEPESGQPIVVGTLTVTIASDRERQLVLAGVHERPDADAQAALITEALSAERAGEQERVIAAQEQRLFAGEQRPAAGVAVLRLFAPERDAVGAQAQQVALAQIGR